MSNRERIASAIDESPFDAVIAISPENFFYVAGAQLFSSRILDDRPTMAIWPKGGPPHILMCVFEVPEVRQMSWITDIHTYNIQRYVGREDSYVERLAALLSDLGLARGTIGLEKRHWSLESWEELRNALPAAEFADCLDLFSSLRMIKSPHEIEILRHAGRSADRAILEAFRFAAPGRTEKQVADVLQCSLIRQGATNVPFLVVGTGPRSGVMHPYPGLPTDRVLEVGDLIRTDVGGVFRFYTSDNMRSAVVGKATQKQRDNWRRVWDVQQAVIEAIRPGIASGELRTVGRDAYRRVGAPNKLDIPFVGHGIGLSMHDPPLLGEGNEQELLPGMVLCIETDVRPSDTEAYDTEDQVLVTETGHEILSRTYDWEELFVTAS